MSNLFAAAGDYEPKAWPNPSLGIGFGRERPRLWTRPARRLTPATSAGFDAIRFGEVELGLTLLPWERWLLIHGLELTADGLPRFDVILVLVARQNGKTTVGKLLALWRMRRWAQYMQRPQTVVGTSTSAEYARIAWRAAVELARDRDRAALDQGRRLWLPGRWSVKSGTLDTSATMENGSLYRVATASTTGGRSLTVDLALIDELREHKPKGENTGWEAWAAIDGATTAVPDAQLWAFSNAGDLRSVVLNTQRAKALEGSPSIGLFEWSAEDSPALDLSSLPAFKQANPGYGYIISERTRQTKLALPAHVFKPEHLCVTVGNTAAAFVETSWTTCLRDGLSLAALRRRVCVAIDVAESGHTSLLAAAVGPDRRVLVDTVEAWGSPDEARHDLRAVLRKVQPRLIGWFPKSPCSVLGADLEQLAARRLRPFETTAAAQACVGLHEAITSGRLQHGGEPLMTTQLLAAGRENVGDGLWKVVRRGGPDVDAVYALAAAVELAKSLPPMRR